MQGGQVLFVERENICYDFGSHAAGLAAAERWRGALRQYRYFVFVNSSVRGPFMPLYATQHWTSAFTTRLNALVKLVGTTISCQSTPYVSDTPHVQSMVFATDGLGLAVLRRAGVFECTRADVPLRMQDVITRAEIGSSVAMFEAGYAIDCLLLKYAGVDWREAWRRKLPCNGRLNPTVAANYDGISVHPLEVLFVKAKANRDTPFLGTVQAYTRFVRGEHDEVVVANAFGEPDFERARERARDGELRAAELCGLEFDDAFYVRASPDLHGVAPFDPWGHFTTFGYYEGRPIRWRARAEAQPAAAADAADCAQLRKPHVLKMRYDKY